MNTNEISRIYYSRYKMQDAGYTIHDAEWRIQDSSWIMNHASFYGCAGVAQLARASAFQAEGRGFESRLPLKNSGAHVAQSAEHILGKDEVSGSSPLVGSKMFNGKKAPNLKLQIPNDMDWHYCLVF